MTSKRLLRAADFTLWVVTVSAAVVAVGAVLSFALGDGLLTLKYLLFVVGFLMFGVGSIGIQPRSMRRRAKERAGEDTGRPTLGSLSTDDGSEYGFEERLHTLPPLRDEWLPPDDRVSRDWKLFVTSLVVLAVSLWLEVGVGVTP